MNYCNECYRYKYKDHKCPPEFLYAIMEGVREVYSGRTYAVDAEEAATLAAKQYDGDNDYNLAPWAASLSVYITEVGKSDTTVWLANAESHITYHASLVEPVQPAPS